MVFFPVCLHPRPTRLLTAVQLLAWIDLVLFLVLVGPTILFSLSTNTLNPSFRSSHYHPHHQQQPSDTVSTNTAAPAASSAPTTTTITFNEIVLYPVDRPPSQTENGIIYRIREGCGRNYARNIPYIWKSAKEHLSEAMALFFTALAVTLFSSILFLIVVPAQNLLGHVTPLVHLSLQLTSVICSILGVHNIINRDVCILQWILPSFRIQSGVSVVTLLVTLTYKLYEISLIDAYIRLHLRAIQQQLYSAAAAAADNNGFNSDQQLQLLIDTLNGNRNNNKPILISVKGVSSAADPAAADNDNDEDDDEDDDVTTIFSHQQQQDQDIDDPHRNFQ